MAVMAAAGAEAAVAVLAAAMATAAEAVAAMAVAVAEAVAVAAAETAATAAMAMAIAGGGQDKREMGMWFHVYRILNYTYMSRSLQEARKINSLCVPEIFLLLRVLKNGHFVCVSAYLFIG